MIIASAMVSLARENASEIAQTDVVVGIYDPHGLNSN